MANDLTNKGNGGNLVLTDDYAAKLLSGIAESRASTRVYGGGKPLLRLMKGGPWVYGINNEEVGEDTLWLVNIMSLQHGWCCWVDGELKGEVMVSMSLPKPPMPAPINGIDYKEQRNIDMRACAGEDEGTDVLYKCNSMSGIDAVIGLLAEIQKRLATPEGRRFPCPVLSLGHSWYPHPKYSRVTTPVYNIVGWGNMNGDLEGAATSKIAAVKDQAPEKAPEPVSTQQAHVGQRRRPVAR